MDATQTQTGNPLVDNPELKARFMASLQAPSQMKGLGLPAPGSPVAPPAQMPPIQMPSGASPTLPQSSQPRVNAPQGTVEGDEAERSRLIQSGPGISQIAHNIENSHLGQAHPILGKILGIGAQGAATLGDIALNSTGLGRGIEPLIPGTEGHHNLLLHRENAALTQDEGDREKEAQTQNLQSETPLHNAQTAHLQEETSEMPGAQQGHLALEDAQVANLLHPEAKNEWEGYAQQERAAGRVPDVSQFMQMQSQAKEGTKGTKEQIQAKLVQAQNSGDIQGAAALRQQLKDIDPLGEQRIVIQQQGQNNAQQKARDQKTESEFTYTRNKWDKDLQSYQGQNDKLAEAESLIGKGAMGDAIGSIKALSGLASGQGSGVRITQAELNSIAHARGFGGDFDAYLQKFGDGRNLTPQQEQELKGILADIQGITGAKQKVLNKVLDDLSEAPDPATIRKIDSQARRALMGGS